MLPRPPNSSHLADFEIHEVSARAGEQLPVGTALPLIFAMSLLLWSMIAMTARALF